MWLLSCEGDLFDGKRLWLRPGSTHLLGRTSGKSANGERVQYIDHKSVSRKHLVLKVGAVKNGDSALLHVRSEVQATDSSKTGTTIDGQKINSATRVLGEGVHTIKLGSYASVFHLQWHPVVVSLTTLPKAAKSRSEALATYRQRVEHAGIKLVTEYTTNQTTHLIAKKRNTAAGLQALVQGRWLLVDSFVNALADACDRKEEGETEEPGISLLEQDFDANWPREDAHIVPAGGEPVARPNDDLKPDSRRSEVFRSMTFVFLSQSQHDQLVPVVTSGGGKAAVHPFELGESTTNDVVEFVRQLAGFKSARATRFGQSVGQSGVVVVRSVSKEEGREQDIMRDIEIALNQRSMEQNEFLDAIITNDATTLIRPLRDAPSDSGDVRSNEHNSMSPRDETTMIESPRADDKAPSPIPGGDEAERSQLSGPTRRRNKQIVTASRFKGFDDFDPSQVVEPESPLRESTGPDEEANQTPAKDDDEISSGLRVPRKRRAPEDPIEAERRMLDTLAPSTVGPKRPRLEQHRDAATPAPASGATRATRQASKQLANVLNMDIKGALKENRQQEEERRRQDEEYLHNALGVDLGEVRKLVQVEEFELPVRIATPEQPPTLGRRDGDDRQWNPAWNGRQNFKKFRRLGQTQQDSAAPPPPPPPKRLVALEEVSRTGSRAEEDYFLQSSADQSRRSQSQVQSSTRSSAQTRTDTNERDARSDQLSFRRRIQLSHEEDAEAAELEHLVPDATAVRTSVLTLVADSQQRARDKRPAAEPLGGAATKRPRQVRVAASPAPWTKSARHVVSDDDDDDALMFRRKKR